MAWTSMHFAVGMCGTGVISGLAALALRRGYRWLPLAMTAGGIWALIPDMPRIFRVDFPSLPFAATLGSKNLENWLHSIGDLFFFHERLDIQPQEFALLGMAITIGLYVASTVMLMVMVMESRQRHSTGNRAWRAKRQHAQGRHASQRQRHSGQHAAAQATRSSHLSGSR